MEAGDILKTYFSPSVKSCLRIDCLKNRRRIEYVCDGKWTINDKIKIDKQEKEGRSWLNEWIRSGFEGLGW